MSQALIRGLSNLTLAPAFSALRVYVLSRSKYIGLLVFVLSLGPVGPNLVNASMFLI